MDYPYLIVLPTVGGFILYHLIRIAVLSKGRSLQSRFRYLGQLKGRTLNQIVEAVGRPSAVSSLPAGKTAVQWIAPGYHIVLRLAGNGRHSICEGVTHEFSAGGGSAKSGGRQVSDPAENRKTEALVAALDRLKDRR